ncbi:MAG: hypothetical protein ACK56F_21610, partial [bacterium]
HRVLSLHHPLGEIRPDSALHPLIGQLLGCGDLVEFAGEERELLGPSLGGHARKLVGRQVGLGNALQEVAGLLGPVARVLGDTGVDQPLEAVAGGCGTRLG